MDWETLKNKLVVNDGVFCLVTDVLTTNVDTWLKRFFSDATLLIRQATRNEEANTVVISGQISLFNVDGVPAEAVFSVNEEADVCVVLKIELNPAEWTFFKSFPDIPGGERNPLSDIQYSECCLILANQYVADYEGHELYDGLNFKGILSSSPLMTLLSRTWNVFPVMFGHINLDVMTTPDPLSWGEFPFAHDSIEKPLPGFVFTVEIQDYTQFEIMDGVLIDQLGLRIYCPPNKKFSEDNPTYITFSAFHGELVIQKLGIKQECWVNYVPDATSFQIINNFEKLSLENLANVGFLCGNADLKSLLPDALVPIGDLSLTQLCFGFTLANATPSLEYVMIAIGMPNTNWEVLDGKYSVGKLNAEFLYNPKAEEGENKFGVSVSGIIRIDDHDVEVRADNENGFTLYINTMDTISLSLGKVLQKFWPDLDAPMELTVDRLGCEISPSNHVSVGIKMASDGEGWHIPIGPNKDLVLSDISMFFAYNRSVQQIEEQSKYSGSISGTIAFTEELQLSASFAYPAKSVSILMYLPDFSLKDFIEKFGGDTTFLPDAFDFTLTQSMVQFEKEQDNYHLRLATLVDNCGLMMLDLLSGSQGKGVIFGINIDGDKFGNFLGLPDLSEFNKVFSLKQLVLIASTTDLNGYSFPGTEQFDVPALKDHEMNNPSGGNLIEGLNFMARWSINTGNAVQNMLRNLLNLDLDMLVVLQIGTSNEYRLYAEMDGKICEVPIKAQVGAKYSGGELAFFVAGSMTFIIQEHPQEFVLEIGVTTGGAYGSGTMKSQVPLDFGIIKLGNLALQIGVSWEGVPTIGIAGNIMLGENLNSSIAILFDSENPAKSMVAGSVSNFTLADVFDAFLPENCQSKQLAAESITDVKEILSWFKLTGTNTFDLSTDLTEKFDGMVLDDISKAFAEHGVTISSNINEVYYSIGAKRTRWYIASLEKNRPRYYEIERTTDETTGEEVLRVYTEAQFYMVPEKTNIGALVYDRGFYLNGRLTLKDFFFEGEVDIEEDRFTARAEMSKVELGNGLLCLSGVNDDGTPSDKGPELRISTIGPDYGYLNAYISFLGFKSKWKGIVNEEGFDVSFDVKGLVAKTTLTTRLCGTDSFFAEVGMEFEPVIFKALDYLGKSLNINLKTSAIGTATIDVSKKDGFNMSVSASFYLFGKKVDLINIMVGVTPKDIEDIVDAVYEAIKAYILGLLKDAEMFAKMVLDNVIEGIKDLGKVLVELYHKTLEEAMAIIDKAREFLAKVCAMETAAAELPG